MIRIAYLIDTFIGPSGGTENQLLRAIHRLDPARFETALFTLQRSPWLEQTQLPCLVEWLRFRSFARLDFLRRQGPFLSHCRKHHVDIVQSFFRDSNILGALWGRQAGVKAVIASRRNIGADYWHTWKEVRILRILSRYTTHYIANSKAAAEETQRVEGVPPERITVVPNCLDTAAYAKIDAASVQETRRRWGVPDGALVVGAIANLRPIKNLSLLVRAARSVVDRIPGTRFVILGEGPDRAPLEQLVQSLDLLDSFVLPGISRQVARDLHGFDLSVLCSVGESSPNAVLESMAAGIPCVVSDVGGNGELIVPGENGSLFPSQDAESFADRIVELLTDEATRHRFGAKGRLLALDHEERTVIPKLEELYQSLVSRSPRG